MNIVLWILQAIGALVYGASGVMKVFMFDKVSAGIQSGELSKRFFKPMTLPSDLFVTL